VGDTVKKGTILGYIEKPERNGGWFSHLHLQIMHEEYVKRFPTFREIDGYQFTGKIGDIPGLIDPMSIVQIT